MAQAEYEQRGHRKLLRWDGHEEPLTFYVILSEDGHADFVPFVREFQYARAHAVARHREYNGRWFIQEWAYDGEWDKAKFVRVVTTIPVTARKPS